MTRHPASVQDSQRSPNRASAHVVALVGLSVQSALALAGCGSAQVETFTVAPPAICAGQSVTLTWDVKGRASLKASPAPVGWSDGPVASTGSMTAAPTSTTTFAVIAVDANPANGNSSGSKVVQVAAGSSPRAATTQCDAAEKKFEGSFALDGYSSAIKVARISAPTAVRAGVESPRRICVTHDGRQLCLDPNQAVDFAAPAAGTWVLDADRSADESCTPPLQLHVQIDFQCP